MAHRTCAASAGLPEPGSLPALAGVATLLQVCAAMSDAAARARKFGGAGFAFCPAQEAAPAANPAVAMKIYWKGGFSYSEASGFFAPAVEELGSSEYASARKNENALRCSVQAFRLGVRDVQAAGMLLGDFAKTIFAATMTQGQIIRKVLPPHVLAAMRASNAHAALEGVAARRRPRRRA